MSQKLIENLFEQFVLGNYDFCVSECTRLLPDPHAASILARSFLATNNMDRIKELRTSQLASQRATAYFAVHAKTTNEAHKQAATEKLLKEYESCQTPADRYTCAVYLALVYVSSGDTSSALRVVDESASLCAKDHFAASQLAAAKSYLLLLADRYSEAADSLELFSGSLIAHALAFCDGTQDAHSIDKALASFSALARKSQKPSEGIQNTRAALSLLKNDCEEARKILISNEEVANWSSLRLVNAAVCAAMDNGNYKAYITELGRREGDRPSEISRAWNEIVAATQ